MIAHKGIRHSHAISIQDPGQISAANCCSYVLRAGCQDRSRTLLRSLNCQLGEETRLEDGLRDGQENATAQKLEEDNDCGPGGDFGQGQSRSHGDEWLMSISARPQSGWVKV